MATLALGGIGSVVGINVTGGSNPSAKGSRVGHVSPSPAPDSHGKNVSPPSEPGLLRVFGVTGTRAPLSKSPYASDWNAMLTRQQNFLKNPLNARHYRSFLAQFDQYRGEPLMQMATNVNALVESQIKYSDNTNCTIPNTDATTCSNADYYWRSPVETALLGEGNCINQAALQYFIMRYLGVPTSRLFLADVNAYGNQTAGTDHTILLLNTAPVGAAPKLVIMNDATPVIPANDSLVERTWLVPGNIKADFSLYDVFNGANSWLTKYTHYDYITSSAQKRPPAARPGHKAQVARVNPPAFRRFGKA